MTLEKAREVQDISTYVSVAVSQTRAKFISDTKPHPISKKWAPEKCVKVNVNATRCDAATSYLHVPKVLKIRDLTPHLPI